MRNLIQMVRPGWWLLLAAVVTIPLAVAGYAYLIPPAAHHASADADDDLDGESAVSVETVRPTSGGIERTTVQPGTLQAFEFAYLYAEVSGFLKTLTVDIGDRVTKGQVLATIDVPDLQKLVEKNRALLQQAEANVKLMQAALERYRAEARAAEVAITQAEHSADAARATRVYRQKAYLRIKQLFESRSIEERLVDEKLEQRDAAIATERAAVAAIATARSQAEASAARVKQAEAEVAHAQAQVGVARADLERAEVEVGFATVRSPYTGVVTRRNYFPGDFVRAASGSERTALLVVERTDKLRMVVQVPDRDVPFADPGDLCDVEIDAVPGDTWRAGDTHPVAVSRVQGSEDLETRTMRVEIDLPNPTGRLRQGMYGRATIHLEKPELTALSIPSRCLSGKVEGGRGAVYVVRDDLARRVEVRVGADNGVRTEILGGLRPTDEVVSRSSGGLSDGTPVVRTTRPKARVEVH